MASHKTRPGHKHTKVFGPDRKVQRMTARYHVLNTVKQLMDDDPELTSDDACAMAGIPDLVYMHACGD